MVLDVEELDRFDPALEASTCFCVVAHIAASGEGLRPPGPFDPSVWSFAPPTATPDLDMRLPRRHITMLIAALLVSTSACSGEDGVQHGGAG